MTKKRLKAEESLNKLREADVMISQGKTIPRDRSRLA